MPFCLARLGSEVSKSSKGWQKSLSGVLVREDAPCNWRSDGRSPDQDRLMRQSLAVHHAIHLDRMRQLGRRLLGQRT